MASREGLVASEEGAEGTEDGELQAEGNEHQTEASPPVLSAVEAITNYRAPNSPLLKSERGVST